ncbi:putative ubiquitin-conjugating enzyme E2 [Vairimorpha necatrix]|uniref:Ubiquitin-conjugating enzyme E2 n=1 Tax=Vairimorpha necatrix TaxID=6039 RepID=A0AAX4JF72_9MICR
MSSNKLSAAALKRLVNEEKLLKKETDHIFMAFPRTINGKTIYKTWDVYFRLYDENSLYKGKIIEAEITFPEDYPHHPPKFVFKTKMFHPNIYEDGKVCISILEEDSPGPLGCGAPEDRWSPVQNIRVVCLSMVILLDNPNPDSPANVDAAKMFREVPNDNYKKQVKELIETEDKKSRKKQNVFKIISKL